MLSASESKSHLSKLRKAVAKLTSITGTNEEHFEEYISTVVLLFAVHRLFTVRAQCGLLKHSAQPSMSWNELDSKLAQACVYSLQSRVELLSNQSRPSVSRQVADSIYSRTNWPQLSETIDQTAHIFNALGNVTLGYVYQFLCSSMRDAAQKNVQSANKSPSMRDVISFTQLYTPPWVVQYLLNNTVGAQWNHKDATLLFPLMHSALEGNGAPQKSAERITLLDPSCGAGHFLLPAFDIFVRMYKAEEKTAEQAVQYALQNNIHGTDIDGMALWTTAIGLTTAVLSEIPEVNVEALPRIRLDAATPAQPDASSFMGSLLRAWEDGHVLAAKYSVIAGNPPYIGRRLLDRSLKARLKASYPQSHQDVSAAFLQRGLELLEPGGRLGYITQSSLLHLPTYSDLRSNILQEESLISVVHAGTQVFPLHTGEKVNSILLVIEHTNPDHTAAKTIFVDISDETCKSTALEDAISGSRTDLIRERSQSDFLEHDRQSINFKFPTIFTTIRRKAVVLADYADAKQGLATSDNNRFVKYWWEVPAEEFGSRWIPYVKGAGGERWWKNINTVVDWGKDGQSIKEAVASAYPYLNGKTAWVVKNEQFYGREGLTFSLVNSRQLALRYLPEGCIFDVAGSAIFPHKEHDLFFLLGYLNSSFSGAAAYLINPTINFQVGDLKQLPIIEMEDQAKEAIVEAARVCYTGKRNLSALAVDARASNQDFLFTEQSPEGTWTEWHEKIRRCESAIRMSEELIDRKVLEQVETVFGIHPGMRALCEEKAAERRESVCGPRNLKELARLFAQHWVMRTATAGASWNADILSASDPGTAAFQATFPDWFARATGTSLRDYLLTDFAGDHASAFKGKPFLRVSSKGNGIHIERLEPSSPGVLSRSRS